MSESFFSASILLTSLYVFWQVQQTQCYSELQQLENQSVSWSKENELPAIWIINCFFKFSVNGGSLYLGMLFGQRKQSELEKLILERIGRLIDSEHSCCSWWRPLYSNHVSTSWLVSDVPYSSLCKGRNMRKRVLFRAKHECAFPERSCCAWCWTEWLCGQKNNAEPFALLSHRETTSSKEAKSVDSVSPTTSTHCNNLDDCEKRALWKWVWLLRGFY